MSKAPRLRHVAPFDGMRGFGVIGVMLGHALPHDSLSFSAIVDWFFVLSGFLITTLLLQEHRDTGGVNVRNFYARRMFRLLPGLYAMLAGSAVIGIVIKATGHLQGEQTLGNLAKEMVAAALYVHNIVFPTNNGPWIDHLWTLSIEEQFYLVIGVLAFLFIARGRIKLVTWTLVVLVAVIQLSRLFLVAGPFPQLAGAVWLQRPDSLMVGMLGAIFSAHLADPVSAVAKRRLSIAGWAGAVGLFVATWASTKGHLNLLHLDHPYTPANAVALLNGGARPSGFYWIQWGNTVASWSAVAITICASRYPEWWPNRFLSLRFFVWTGGLLSYSLYLWHVPIQELMRAFLPKDLPWPIWIVLAVAAPFAVAYPSYLYIEKRALRFKDRFAVTPNKPT
ncbi:MAG: acyltransferase [Acidimicrobiales bacterium]